VNAAVLAGGRSRRFGRDKLLEPILGKPLAQHVIDSLRASGAVFKIYLITTPGREWVADLLEGVDGVVSESLGAGPAGAVLAAVKSLGTSLAVAGDMPAISPEFVEAFVSECLPRLSQGALACSPSWGGFVEPLHTIYSVRAAGVLEDWVLIRGRRSLQALIKSLASSGRAALINASGFEWCFTNVNTVDDVREAEALIPKRFWGTKDISLRCSRGGGQQRA